MSDSAPLLHHRSSSLGKLGLGTKLGTIAVEHDGPNNPDNAQPSQESRSLSYPEVQEQRSREQRAAGCHGRTSQVVAGEE